MPARISLTHTSCLQYDDDAIVRRGKRITEERPKLLDRVRAEIRGRHYSRRTEEAYVHWIRRYILFHGKRYPTDLGASEVTAFLTWLAIEKSVAASTQNQAFSAVTFLYKDVLRHDLGVVEHAPRAKTPQRVPVVLSVDEVRSVLRQLSGVPWLVASLLYGAGLRLQESLELRVKEIDFDRREITVRRGKGQKDRAGSKVPAGAEPSFRPDGSATIRDMVCHRAFTSTSRSSSAP